MTLAKQNIPARAKERKELLHEYDVLPEEERFANESLMKILMSRRTKANKSRDLLAEPPSIMGTIALHSTGWDWLSPTHRNTARDLEPCVKAIAVERKYVMRYRPKLFEDKYVATLRRLLENSLQPGVRKIQHIDLARQVTTVHAWLWWDEIPLPTTHEAPAVVLQGLEDSLVKEQSQMRERLALEHEDRVALTKMIAYLTSMPLALSSSDATAMLSADIATPLEALITVSQLYTYLHVPHGAPSLMLTCADLCKVEPWSAVAQHDMRGPMVTYLHSYRCRSHYVVLY
jgi:hypothetical protein